MKKAKKVLKPGFEAKFQTYLDKCGALLDEYRVPKELISDLAMLDMEIQDAIQMEEIDNDKIAEMIAEDSGLRGWLISDVSTWATFEDWKLLAGEMDIFSPFRTISAQSLSEQIKFEAFKERLEENPYQLKIV